MELAASNMLETAAMEPASWFHPRSGPSPYAVKFANGERRVFGDGVPSFVLFVKDSAQLDSILGGDPYSMALDYIRGRFDIQGDLTAAIDFKARHSPQGRRYWLRTLAARFSPSRLESFFQTKGRAARNIRFHYDRSNAFYRCFLDARMVYSCAYFRDPGQSIDDAQLGKLDHICHKLDLRRGESFLDVGCGWGGLILRAAGRYGAIATGCTLSRQQFKFATRMAEERRLEGRVTVCEADYRELRGQFQKIASVGMFEHVGRRRLPAYFRTVHDLLADDGLFLNHGIVRPQSVTDTPETLFLQRKVFPGGELAHLGDVVKHAEAAGFEVLDIENLRPHYALTCRAWIARLQRNASACLREVSTETYRTWLLYLAGSAWSFETGETAICQVLLAKNKPPHARRLTRDYMYTGG